MLITVPALGQTLTLQNKSTLKADNFIGIDNYENLYTVTNNILFKTGVKGDFQFSDLQLGAITSADIINPLKIVVYYKDFNTVVFLDNRLSEIERINFNNLPNFINTGAASNGGNNRLWLLNTDTQQLELYNYSTQKRTIISQPITNQIIAITSNFNYIFVLTDQEVRQYNIYGGLLDVFKIYKGNDITQSNENLVIKTNTKLFHKSKTGTTFSAIDLKEILIVNLQLQQDLLYIYNGKELATFTLNQPKE